MAIVPFLPLQLPWLFDALCGQNWPAGDEDALRRCAQYWDDALNSVGDLAGLGNDTSLGVLANVAAMSADEFAQYWSQYTGGGVKDSALGQLAAQCQAMVAALDGQANEVEYTKLTIDITIVLTAIQILFAIAASVFSLGSSLAEVPLAVFIGKQSVLMLAGRFVQMVLMMVIPDLIAQGWMLEVDHTEASWDGSKTGAALENAVAGAVIGTLLGAGAAKLPFMGEEFGKTIGGKLVQGLGHFVEGGLTMDATTLATAGANYAWADAHGDTQTMQAIQQQLSGDALLRQFASGGLLATAFYLPHLASPDGSPLTFTAEDGNAYTALLDDQALEHLRQNGTLPDGYTAKVYGQNGVRAGTATFNGSDVSIDRPLSDPLSADLTSKPGGQGGFQVTTPDGSTQRWGYPPSGTDPHPTVDGSVVSGDPGQPDPLTVPAEQPRAQLLTYSKPSDGSVPTPAINGITVPDTVPKGSVVHYTAGDSPQIYRVDFIDAKSGTVAVAQAERPGGTLQLTGTTQYEYGPAGIGKLLGVQGATYTAHNFADDGIKSAQVASSSMLTGKMTFGSPDLGRAPEQAAPLYQNAFGDRYNPFAPTTPAGASGFQSAGHEASGAGGGDSAYGHGLAGLPEGPPPASAAPHEAQQVVIIDSTPAALSAQHAANQIDDLVARGGDRQESQPPNRQLAPLPEVPGAVRAGEVAGSPPSWGSKAIVFSDNGKAMEYAEQAWASAIDRLPPEQRAALLAYTGEAIAGSHEVSYQAVNRFLHGRIPETPEIRQAITLLDRAMRLQVVPEDVVVNRTTTAGTFLGADGHRLEDPAELAGLVGSTQTSQGFTSTHFGTYNPGGEEVALHLMVPEGTPGIYLGTISYNPSEHELLLGRGLSITIDRVWSEDGWSGTTWHVQAHVSAIDGHPVAADQGHPGPEITVRGDSPIAHVLNPHAFAGQDAHAITHLPPDGLTPVDPPAGWEHLRGSLFRSDSGLVIYDGSDYRMLQAAAHVHGDGTSFIVDLHAVDGVPQAGTHGDLTPEALASLIKEAGWDGQQRVVLLACDTAGDDGFAARLAALPDMHGVEVVAADGRVWQNASDSQVWVAGRTWSEEHQMWLPDPGQPGHWLAYQHNGTTLTIREVLPDTHGMPSQASTDATTPAAAGQGDLNGQGSAHSPPTANLDDLVSRAAPNGHGEPPLLAAPSPDVLRLDDRVIQGLPKGVLAYHDEAVVLEEHSDASGTYYQVAGDATMYHTPEEAMLSRLHGFANELRSLARAEGVPDELKARFREEAMAREHAAQRMRNAFENARRAAARAVEEEAKGPARAANAIKFRDREARYYQDATREYKAAMTHEAAAEAIVRQASIPSRDERESLPPAAAALHVGDQVIVVTSMRGEGDVRPALHPVVEELYEQARFELTSRIFGLDGQIATVTDAGQRQQLEALRAQLSDQLLQNGRCAEATGLSQWAKQLDEHLQQSDPSLTPTRRNQLILDALQQAHAESVAVDIRYGSGGSAVHGNPKEACANCAVAFKNAGITDLATQRPAVEPPPPGAALQYDPSHPGQQSLTASDLAAAFNDRRNNEPPQVLRTWQATGVDYVTGEAVNRADLPAQVALTPNEWTAALTAMVERIGTNPGLEYGLLSRVGPDGTTTLILVEGGPTQVRPLDGTTLLAHSHPWFGSDRPSFGDFLQLRRKPFEFEYLIAPDGNGHEALVRFSRDGSWTRIATFEDGQWRLGEGHTIQGAAREGTFEAAREQRQEMRARATRLASARSSADLLATDPTLSPAERQEALAEVGRGLAELTGPAGPPGPFVPPELEQVRARLAAGSDLTPAEVAVARDHLAAHEAVAKAEAVAAARQARLTVPGLVARAEDAGAYLNRLWLNDRRPGLIASAIGEDKNAQGGGTTARIDFNHQALVNDIYAAVRDAIRDLPDAPGITELMTRVVQGLGADPKAFSDALVVLRDNGIKGLGHAGLTEAQRVLVADTLDLVTTWQETLHDVAAGKHVPDAPRRDLTLPLPGPASQDGTALAGVPADAGQPRGVLRFPDRITPGELARRMPEFRDQQYQARTDLTLLQQAMDRVSGELDQATLDAASGIPGAGTRVTALRRELDQLSQHEQALRQDLGEFTKKLWATRNRFGLRPDPRDMEPTDPALHHVRDVQRLYSRDHGLPGRAWMGSPPLVPGPELLGGALEVGHAEIPFMERVKRLVSLSGALEEAVRKGEVTPLLPDVVKQQFDAVRAAPRPPDADPALLAARISVLRERVQQLAAYKRLDAPLQSYVDRLIDEAHHEAQQVLPVPHEGTRLPAQAGHASGDSWLDGAKHAAGHPLNATTRNIEGDLVFRLLRTPDGGFYAQFSKVIDLYKIEENQFGAARLTLLDQSLLEHPLTHLGPVDLGVVAGVSMKYALTHGVEFSQSLDRGDAIAIKIWGPGKRVIVTSWDRMPTDRQGQPLITTDVRPVNKHTIKTDLAVSPALFVPGAKAMELPAEAKLSLEVSAGPRRGGGVEWKVQGTAEFVAQSPDFRKAGISAAMDWLKGLGYPGWAPSPESSTEATLVLGPIEFHKLPQAVRQQIANHFASRGVTVTEEGTIPEDQVRQLTGVPVPPRQQPSAIFSALNPPLAARPAAGGQVLPLGPAPSADDRRVLPFNPVPSADDPRLLPFGPAPSADDRRVLPFGPAPSADDKRVLGHMEEGG